MNDSIKALKIRKPSGASEKNYQEWDKKYVTVPKLINKNFNDVRYKLTDFTIEFSGTGKKIIYQSPKAGTRVLEGSKVRILLGD